MRVLSCLLLLGLAAAASARALNSLEQEDWEDFKAKYNKRYDPVEEAFRSKVFVENSQMIADHNRLYAEGKTTFTMKINHFGDMLRSEVTAVLNGLSSPISSSESVATFIAPDSDVVLPDTVDWRQKGAVTPVKDQKQCGSCWAFSATGSLEGQHFLKTGKLVSLSEQNLVDCSAKFGNLGCRGGLMDNAFAYIKANDGIDTEDSYPYKAENGICKFNKSDVGADDTGFVDVPSTDEAALKAAVATVGPVSIAIDASRSSFHFYHSGVYSDPTCSSTLLDHGVLAVGYGSLDDKDYWLVKNSWNAMWGDKGYIYMARNMNNMCGVASKASYPLV